MPDEFDFSDPFERWHRAWFVAPLDLDFGIVSRSAAVPGGFLRSRFAALLGRRGRQRSTRHRLQPVSLGHLIYLQALDSPLLRLGIEDVEITIPDFLTVIRILRDARWPFTTAIDFSPTPEDELLLQAHAEAVAKGNPSPIETALNAQFLPWWFACQSGPELMEDEGADMKSLTAPYALAMSVRLLRTGSFDERRVYEMPLALLRFYASAISEQEGGGNSFLTPEVIEGMKRASELPDLEQSTDEELHALAVAERGQTFADAWLAERIAKRNAAPLNPQPSTPNPPNG